MADYRDNVVACLTAMADAMRFREVCESGKFYDLLADIAGISRKQAKIEVFRDVLFGKYHVQGRVTKAFENRWPSVMACVRQVKKEHGYKIISKALQRVESNIMLDDVGSRLLRELPGVPFVTVHDSVLLMADAAEPARQIMLQTFKEYGVTPKIHVKRLQEPRAAEEGRNSSPQREMPPLPLCCVFALYVVHLLYMLCM